MKWLFIRFCKATHITSTTKFCIRKIVKGESVEYLPMIKNRGLFNEWTPIVKIYDRYEIIPYEKKDGLSYHECEQHIEGYKRQYEADLIQNAFEVAHIEL